MVPFYGGSFNNSTVISKVIVNIPSHYEAIIEFFLVLINSNSTSDLQIYIDDAILDVSAYNSTLVY